MRSLGICFVVLMGACSSGAGSGNAAGAGGRSSAGGAGSGGTAGAAVTGGTGVVTPFEEQTLAIAAEYLSWGRVDDELRWAPFLCRQPLPGIAWQSASNDA